MKPFQILSLDGGGIKGIFSAAVMAHLEEDLQIRITDHFDLIAGTSTGGIIALGLGMGMRPKEILKFYVDNSATIFPEKWTNRVKSYFRHKFDNDPLKTALKDCLGEKLLGESEKRLVIPSYNIGEDNVYLFKTAHHKRLKRDFKVPAWKVAMATSAAPTFFPCFQSLDHVRLIDGGVWANNPAMVSIVEAVSMLDVSLNDISIFSIGTTDEIKGRPKDLDYGGLWQWKTAAVDVVMRGQSIGANTQAQHLLGIDNVLRLDPKVPDGLFALDKLSEKELLGKAAHESRLLSPFFSEKFLDHIALKFTPFNSNNKGM